MAIERVERGGIRSADRTASGAGDELRRHSSGSGARTRRCAVVVETTTLDIAAGQPAIDHVRAALAAGCHVVTANKGPAAFAYAALRALADAPASRSSSKAP